MTGLTSITFRGLTAEHIISLTKQAGLDGIEWGGDVHVPPGRTHTAVDTYWKTEKEGLTVLSYGSYYKLGQNQNPKEAFIPVLDSAIALHAPNIRIWAGTLSPDKAGYEDYKNAAAELRDICDMANIFDVNISLEYHRGTLTENSQSALKLLKLANCRNLYTYWQPNPDITHEQNMQELTEILPYLSNVHVFQWTGANVRHPLSDGIKEWQDYMNIAKGVGKDFILEFVQDDAPTAFLQDAAVLKKMV